MDCDPVKCMHLVVILLRSASRVVRTADTRASRLRCWKWWKRSSHSVSNWPSSSEGEMHTSIHFVPSLLIGFWQSMASPFCHSLSPWIPTVLYPCSTQAFFTQPEEPAHLSLTWRSLRSQKGSRRVGRWRTATDTALPSLHPLP